MTPHQNPETGASGHDDQCCCSFCLAAYDARSKPVAPSLQGGEAGLTVTLVDGPPPIPGVPSHAIRKWENHGLTAGTHRLYAHPKAPELDREAVARAVRSSVTFRAGLGSGMGLQGIDEAADQILALASKQGEES